MPRLRPLSPGPRRKSKTRSQIFLREQPAGTVRMPSRRRRVGPVPAALDLRQGPKWVHSFEGHGDRYDREPGCLARDSLLDCQGVQEAQPGVPQEEEVGRPGDHRQKEFEPKGSVSGSIFERHSGHPSARISRKFRDNRTQRRLPPEAHNPKVAGSNPAPATSQGPSKEGPWCS
jgi:hypothetical protein